SISFSVDTTAPPLMVENEQIDEATGAMLLQGITDAQAIVTVDGLPVTVSSDGRFTATIVMNNQLSRTVSIEASDKVGNKTVYDTELTNLAVKPLAQVTLAPYVN